MAVSSRDRGNDLRRVRFSRQQAKWDNLFIGFRKSNLETELRNDEGRTLSNRYLIGTSMYRTETISNMQKVKEAVVDEFVEKSVDNFRSAAKMKNEIEQYENPARDELLKIVLLEAIKKYIFMELYAKLLETRDIKLCTLLSNIYATMKGLTYNPITIVSEDPGSFGRKVWMYICSECSYLKEYMSITGNIWNMVNAFYDTEEYKKLMGYVESKVRAKAVKMKIDPHKLADFALGP